MLTAGTARALTEEARAREAMASRGLMVMEAMARTARMGTAGTARTPLAVLEALRISSADSGECIPGRSSRAACPATARTSDRPLILLIWAGISMRILR